MPYHYATPKVGHLPRSSVPCQLPQSNAPSPVKRPLSQSLASTCDVDDKLQHGFTVTGMQDTGWHRNKCTVATEQEHVHTVSFPLWTLKQKLKLF